MSKSLYDTLNNSQDDCPFVLELEIDDEISFKPMPKKISPTTTCASQSSISDSLSSNNAPQDMNHNLVVSSRALQPLHENKLPSHLLKTPLSTPIKLKDQTSSKIVKTVEKKNLIDQENDGNDIPISCSAITPKATPKPTSKMAQPTPKSTLRDDIRPPMKSPSPVIIYEDNQTNIATPANIMPSNLHLKRSFLPEYEDIHPIECQNLISRRASFLDMTKPELSDHEEDMVEEQNSLLQTKIDDLEARNYELIYEKELLESRISEILASSRVGELSQADIQVKALTEQLERAKQNTDLLQTEHQVALTSLKNSYEKRITEIITSNAQAVIDMQHRISQEMSQKWENLYQEEQKKVQLLTTSLDSANEKILTLENDLQRVIYETKKKAYEKVKAQFDAGNKEFQKLKLSLKEIVNDKEKVERKVTQQEGKIGELLTEIQSLREQNENYKLQSLALQNLIKSYPLISEVTWTPSSENNLQEAVTILRNFYEMKFQVYGKLSSEWEEKNRQDKSQIMILEGNIRELNQEKMTLNEQIVKCQQEIRQRDEALEQIRQEVDGLKHERDSQLMAIATILQEKNVLDGEYQRKVLEVAELTTRCEGLRQMNEEIVCMLEKVYQEKTDNQ